MRCLILLLLAGCVLVGDAAASPPAAKDPIFGLWLTEDHDAVVELYDCDTKICGRFHWVRLDEANHIRRDEHNHAPENRTRPLCQLQFIGDFKKQDDGSYDEGWIYNPEDGWDYSAEMAMTDADHLKLHGYLLVPALGRSQTWTRVKTYDACKMEDE